MKYFLRFTIICCVAFSVCASGNNVYFVDNAVVWVYLTNRRLQNYAEVKNCYSLDSVRIEDQINGTMAIYADYGEQEVFPFAKDGLYHYFKAFRDVKSYTSNPYDNLNIFHGDRYTLLNAMNIDGIVICFKITCRVKKIIVGEDCVIDSSLYNNPKDFVLEDDLLEYCHFWDDYVDRRTFWMNDYYLIDSVYCYRSLSSEEIINMNLNKIDNSHTIIKYGTW